MSFKSPGKGTKPIERLLGKASAALDRVNQLLNSAESTGAIVITQVIRI